MTEANDTSGPEPLRNILVVCNASTDDEDALTSSTNLARAPGSHVSVLAIVEPPFDIERLARAAGVVRREAEHRLISQHRETIADIVNRIEPNLLPSIDIKVGKPFIEIIRYVIANDIDLVIKNGEELTGVRRHLFASTDQHLLRKCPCPVWLRSPGSSTSVKKSLDGRGRRRCYGQ